MNTTRRARFVWLCVWAALLAALGSSGCAPHDRRRPPKKVAAVVPPASDARPETNPKRILLTLRDSVHAKLDCSDCHAPDAKSAQSLGVANCAHCHEKETKAYARTVHSVARKDGKTEAAGCADCHGTHDIRRQTDPASSVFSRRLPFTCGKCHENAELAKKLDIKAPLAAQLYFESIHGQALVGSGLLVAPSCVDCHGKAHDIFAAEDPRSSVYAMNVAATCGHCHSGEVAAFDQSEHHKALVALDKKGKVSLERKHGNAPSCPSCHTAHSVVQPGRGFRLAADQVCGDCHADRLERYLETYHGRAHSLGDEFVAACHDCHGRHDIRKVSDPASTLSSKNRLGTCRECHDGAPRNFANYLAHANPTDRKHYPGLFWAYVAMTGLLVGTFGFFGLHSLLWLGRGLAVRAKDPAAFLEQKRQMRLEKGARLYTRFRPVDRFVHILVIVSFLLLVITGMPLKFHQQAWARQFFSLIGGPAAAANLHRLGAIITLSYFTIHLASLVGPIRRSRSSYVDEQGRFRLRKFISFLFGPDSPVPNLKDAKDIGAHLKWFVGRGLKPKFDRFTYWEKFDYMAVFWGVTVIGLSGLVMWFPATFTRVLPGWAINVAHLIHSDEALLAAGFIFTFHFFNSHFRPDKFPLDSVMFSGRVTEAEMRHEHPAQYERLEREGRLEELAVRDEWPEWKWVFNTFGVVAILVGVSLAFAIFWAMTH